MVNPERITYKFTQTRLPYILLIAGMTLDGKIATRTGSSQWINNQAARVHVHHIRSHFDAILVGVNTAIIDNPELTSRIPGGKNPIRVVLDSSLRIPVESKLVQDQKAPTWVFTSMNHSPTQKKILEAHGARVFVTSGERKVNLADVLQQLGENGIQSLMVEGGSTIHGLFLDEGMFDQVTILLAPKIVGGATAPSPFGGLGIATMSDAIELGQVTVENLDGDLCISGYRRT